MVLQFIHQLQQRMTQKGRVANSLQRRVHVACVAQVLEASATRNQPAVAKQKQWHETLRNTVGGIGASLPWFQRNVN